MIDIKTTLVDQHGRFSWKMAGPSLEQDDSLLTAIILCLFCDSRALDSDELPDDFDTDRRGWPGSSIALPTGMQLGSRLWLLVREKQTQQTLNRAKEYAVEGLRPLRTLGAASRIDVEAVIPRSQVLGLLVDVWENTGNKRRFSFELETA